MSNSHAACTTEEVVRLLAACDQAQLPQGMELSAPDWWRTWIVEVITTGRRLSEIMGNDVELPHGQDGFHETLRDLFKAAGINVQGRILFHGLRKLSIEQQTKKGREVRV